MSTRERSLELFKSLIKDGCYWQGDIVSPKWAERLVYPQDPVVIDRVARTLAVYKEGVDFKIDLGYVLIA